MPVVGVAPVMLPEIELLQLYVVPAIVAVGVKLIGEPVVAFAQEAALAGRLLITGIGFTVTMAV